ncbi:hypothetical protein THRCLA_11868 [Thraustotheca clavata]|uniref:WW domain-containing protein n=1 Tax=Thraustotheca clavata TaxID=74557 RepID=A0A1V9Y664_9STRA|nr:hypothetical protein THRCLA_11868 [Thraustotheca clavata]
MKNEEERLVDVLKQEELVEMHETFMELTVDDLTALRSFPSHPHRLLHTLLAIIYLILNETRNPSLDKLTWTYLRDTLIKNPSKLLHELHKRLEYRERLKLMEIVPICLLYLEEPAYRLNAVKQVSGIAAALLSWICLCLATLVPPIPSTLIVPKEKENLHFQRCFRHVVRRIGKLYIAYAALKMTMCDVSASKYRYTTIDAQDIRYKMLFNNVRHYCQRALHSIVNQAMHQFQWPYTSHFDMNLKAINMSKTIIKCYLVLMENLYVVEVGVALVHRNTTLAELREALTMIRDFTFYYRGSRVSMRHERKLQVAQLLPVISIALNEASFTPHYVSHLRAISQIENSVNLTSECEISELISLPFIKLVSVQLHVNNAAESVSIIINHWAQHGFFNPNQATRIKFDSLQDDVVIDPFKLLNKNRKYHDQSLLQAPVLLKYEKYDLMQLLDSSSREHSNCMCPQVHFTKCIQEYRAFPLYVVATLQSSKPQEWKCTIETPSTQVFEQILPGTYLRFCNDMEVAVKQSQDIDIKNMSFYVELLQSSSTQGWPRSTNVWKLIPKWVDQRPQWLNKLELHILHPTMDFATSPLYFSYFRLRLPYSVPDMILEEMFWSKSFDWTKYVAATPCQEMLCEKYKELCEVYPFNYFIDSVKFAKFIRDCQMTPREIQLGTLDGIFFKHSCPIFRHQMELEGFLAAVNSVVELTLQNVNEPLRHFVVYHMIEEPHSAAIMTRALERFRTQAKMDEMQALAIKICASIRLQAVYRGHVVYQQYQHHLALLKQRRLAAIKIQSIFRMRIYVNRFMILLAEYREQQRLAAIEAEHRRKEEEYRLFLLGKRVRLQRWVRHRMEWRGYYRKLHPEWAEHCCRMKMRKKLYLDRMGSCLDGIRVIITVFRSHINSAKDRKLRLEVFDPNSCRTYAIDVHESLSTSIWIELDSSSKVKMATLAKRSAHHRNVSAIRIQALYRGYLERQLFVKMLPNQYDVFYDITRKSFVYENIKTKQRLNEPPFHNIYPKVRFNQPKDMWQMHYDVSSGLRYYYNPARDISTWYSEQSAASLVQKVYRRKRQSIIGHMGLQLIVQALMFHSKTKQYDALFRDVIPFENTCFRWPVLANPSDALALGIYALFVQHVFYDLDRAEILFRRALFADGTHQAILEEYTFLQHERSPEGIYSAAGPSKISRHRSIVHSIHGDWELHRDNELDHFFWYNKRSQQAQWTSPFLDVSTEEEISN